MSCASDKLASGSGTKPRSNTLKTRALFLPDAEFTGKNFICAGFVKQKTKYINV